MNFIKVVSMVAITVGWKENCLPEVVEGVSSDSRIWFKATKHSSWWVGHLKLHVLRILDIKYIFPSPIDSSIVTTQPMYHLWSYTAAIIVLVVYLGCPHFHPCTHQCLHNSYRAWQKVHPSHKGLFHWMRSPVELGGLSCLAFHVLSLVSCLHCWLDSRELLCL